MILSDLLGCPVMLENRQIGHIIDVRLVPDPTTTDQPMPRLRIYGLLVSPHAKSSTLGYERSTVRSPRLIARWQRWLHRGSYLVRWADIETIHNRRIDLRPGHHRYSPLLVASAAPGPDFDEREH